jgi:hypothetical protein
MPTPTAGPGCQVLIRVNGVEQWVDKPLPFCTN